MKLWTEMGIGRTFLCVIKLYTIAAGLKLACKDFEKYLILKCHYIINFMADAKIRIISA